MLYKTLKLIGYVRTVPGGLPRERQCDTIKQFCKEHHHKLLAFYYDEGAPNMGLDSALQGLEDVDGLAIFDLKRLIPDNSDTLRELAPLLKNNFLQKRKKIVSVTDGMENITPTGQENLIGYLNQHEKSDQLAGLALDTLN